MRPEQVDLSSKPDRRTSVSEALVNTLAGFLFAVIGLVGAGVTGGAAAYRCVVEPTSCLHDLPQLGLASVVMGAVACLGLSMVVQGLRRRPGIEGFFYARARRFAERFSPFQIWLTVFGLSFVLEALEYVLGLSSTFHFAVSSSLALVLFHIVVHELGHFIAARAVGFDPHQITAGPVAVHVSRCNSFSWAFRPMGTRCSRQAGECAVERHPCPWLEFSMQTFEYVGPEEIRIRSRTAPSGTPIRSRPEIVEWLRSQDPDENGWATYVVNSHGTLLVAPRRSEHVACAGGEAVLAAGEVGFESDGTVVAVTNHSTGYCPAETCWPAVAHALDAASLPRPDAFSFVAVFRRCPNCRERNLVKEDWFVCALCDTDLPREWNFHTERP